MLFGWRITSTEDNVCRWAQAVAERGGEVAGLAGGEDTAYLLLIKAPSSPNDGMWVSSPEWWKQLDLHYKDMADVGVEGGAR